MNYIKIIQTHLPTTFSENLLLELIDEFPKDLKEYILEFQRPSDRNLSAVGYSLLAYILKPYGISLKFLDRDIHNRPFIKEFAGDFNISHSHQSTICAVSTKGRIGIDIEYIRDIELTPFQEQFSSKQWQRILNNSNTLKSFYNAWCKKEAIIKLDGRGLGIELREIPLAKTFTFDNKRIYCQNINIGRTYSAAIAYDVKEEIFPVVVLDFEVLLD